MTARPALKPLPPYQLIHSCHASQNPPPHKLASTFQQHQQALRRGRSPPPGASVAHGPASCPAASLLNSDSVATQLPAQQSSPGCCPRGAPTPIHCLLLQPPHSCSGLSESLRGLLTPRCLQGLLSHWGVPAAHQREGPSSSLAPDMKATPAIGGNLPAFDGHCRAAPSLGLKNFASHILP